MSLKSRSLRKLFAMLMLLLASAALVSAANFFAGVPSPSTRSGHPNNVIASGFSLNLVVQGSDPLENPSGVITHYGYLNDFPPQTIEQSKTEPDIPTYLVLDHNPGGPTADYDYGRHFLFHGHENASDLAYITRTNLDINDPAHRITLLTPVDGSGKTNFNRIDGSVWNPHTQTLLFTQENGSSGGVIEIGADWGSTAHTLYGILGRGGYEGIHPDEKGNLILLEDVGGTSVNVNPADLTSPKAARNPNSFVYRFVPNNIADLSQGGKLQALQVKINGIALTFVPIDGGHPFGDVFSDNQLKLNTLGTSWPTQWITIHDTNLDGTASFDANAAAKSAGATPFKRPENGQFLPGSHFNTFFFDATGDTSQVSGEQPALGARGAWGSIFRLDFDGNGLKARISIVVLGDFAHSSFDNLAFVDSHTLLAAEDRGDSLHKQLNRLDSIWAFDVSKKNPNSARLIALGRDTASETDAAFLDASTPGFQNDGDNEPTGLIVSDGSADVDGMIGVPQDPGTVRIFFNQQHGLNRQFEIL
jgi:hypothetical protein